MNYLSLCLVQAILLTFSDLRVKIISVAEADEVAGSSKGNDLELNQRILKK